jgi:hypothetical protein
MARIAGYASLDFSNGVVIEFGFTILGIFLSLPWIR